MSKPTFAERCLLAEQCLPDAPYRAMLKKLHSEMLEALTEQPAQREDWGPGPHEYHSLPAQRTWQGLTDEEIVSVVSLAGFAPDWAEAHIAIQIVRVLEAKLKEKNT